MFGNTSSNIEAFWKHSIIILKSFDFYRLLRETRKMFEPGLLQGDHTCKPSLVHYQVHWYLKYVVH